MLKFNGFPHIMKSQQFSREWLEKCLFPLADRMERVFQMGSDSSLKNKRMVTLFYEPSTRTRLSFQMAMDHLGGSTVFSTENAREFSSGAKGESLEHTIKVINRYKPDVIVLRYDQEIGSEIAAKISRVPIINAGDRNPGQHVTQGLLDIRTIKKCLGHIDGLNITIVGDLKNGRTARSLAYLLGKFQDVSINFVSPESSQMGDKVKQYLTEQGIQFQEFIDVREVAASTDCIYQTRVQKEIGSSFGRTDNNGGYYAIDKTVTAIMKKDAIIMHPLPIDGDVDSSAGEVKEISDDVDDDPRSVYLTHQIDSGLFVRMALLKIILVPNSII